MAAFSLDAKQNREAVGMGALKGAGQGLAAGASIGTAINPGIGTVIGAVSGGIAGGIRGGTMAGIDDKQVQQSEFDAEQAVEAAKKKAIRDANQDIQASARSSSTPRPVASGYAYSPQAFATPGVGLTGYDTWKMGG